MPSSFVESRINQNLEVATEYFKALVSENKKSTTDKIKQSAGSIGFIPYNISFTMDGLGGIKIYNELALDTSFLPAGYTSTTEFIVTGVNHKISNGDWETDITATLIPRTSPITDVITGSVQIFGQIETAPVIPPTIPQTISTTGPEYDPIKSVIFSGESSNYDALFPSTTYQAAFGKSSLVTTIAEVVANTKNPYTYQSGKKKDGTPNYATVSTRAVGRYQNLGSLLYQRAQSAGLDPNTALYNEANQEKIGEYLINTVINNYFSSEGSQSQLEYAVTRLAGTWSSMPTVKNGDNAIVGNVVTGEGIKGYYTSGINAKDKKYTVGTVVKALIQTYKNLNNGKLPKFVPSYTS